MTKASKKNMAAGTGESAVKMKGTRRRTPRESPKQRSSAFRGVTRHRWTGRYEAHLWDKNCWNESQTKKGRQVYLGAYDDEQAAAHSYDLAALKYWGQQTALNFPVESYKNELKEMEGQTMEEYIGSLRRKSSGFSRGVSKYRGVARHHHNGRWEARIGRVFGNKYLYLGTYATQEEAAIAYDVAAIQHRGLNALTNFDLSHYIKWFESFQSKNTDQLSTKNDIVVDQETPPKSSELVGKMETISSTLGLFLQSSKFREMLMEQKSEIRSSSSEPEPRRRCFPDDVQTLFDFQDLSSFDDEHGVMFGDYGSEFASEFFPCE